MSRGMWTKCYSLDGSKVFYYNSAKNESSWIAPPDSIIHEAVNLKPPSQTTNIDEFVGTNNENNNINAVTKTETKPIIANLESHYNQPNPNQSTPKLVSDETNM